MDAAEVRGLTKRQLDVLKRIDRRVPIKVIAQELGVSETRINQHIRALKDFYKVDSLNELVECYREEFGEDEAPDPEVQVSPEGELSEAAYRKKQLAEDALSSDRAARVDPGEIVLSDVMPLSGLVPWKVANQPRVVPGVLDGENAVLLRLVAIIGIAIGILAAIVLTVTAAMTLSEAMDGKAAVPEDYYKSA